MAKYGNRKTIIGNKIFDSAHEAQRYRELLLLQKAGEIEDLRTQVKYELIPKQYGEDGKLIEKSVNYYADFVYMENGKTVVEDAKGCRTKEYIIKRKLMLHVHGIRIREV